MAVGGGLSIGTGLGALGLGAPQAAQNFALPAMPKTMQPYIAHLYDHNLVFKRLLGATAVSGGLLSKPGLKQTQNGGFQGITLEVAKPVTGITLGDVIRLTEANDPTNAILFSGNVESTPDVQAQATHHTVTVAPWITELGDGFFSKTYATPTDVAQFVRDAVATTAHCSVSPISCPNSGITAVYDFQNTSPLDAVHVAKQIAGAFFWYFVDAQGLVWFQQVYPTNPATLTLQKSADITSRKPITTTKGMRNKIPLIGGSNPGDPGRITALYSGATSQALYGVKSYNPTITFPNITDQATLNTLATSLGALYDRVVHTDEIDCPALGLRLTPGRPGGLLVRIREEAHDPLESTVSEYGTGTYSPTLILQDVETDGPRQRLYLGDIPFTDIDPGYEAARVAQRTSAIAATAIPTPPLVAPVAVPINTTITTRVTATTTGILAMGGGIVAVGSATFTTTRTGVCQVTGQIDARMEAWDNYVGTPRRAVWADLPTIVTGAKQELPFGLTRATYDLSSASGLAIPAGTYTLTIYTQTTATNQIHVYSGWAQVTWTG